MRGTSGLWILGIPYRSGTFPAELLDRAETSGNYLTIDISPLTSLASEILNP